MTYDGDRLASDRVTQQWLPSTTAAKAKRKMRCLECGDSPLRSTDLTRAETFALTHARFTGHREFEETTITPQRLRLPGDKPMEPPQGQDDQVDGESEG